MNPDGGVTLPEGYKVTTGSSQANGTITHKHAQLPWSVDGKRDQGIHIEPGDSLFTLRSVEPTGPLYTDVPVYQLNHILRQLAMNLARENSSDTQTLMQHIRAHGEADIMAYAQWLSFDRMRGAKDAAGDLIKPEYSTDHDTAKKMYELAVSSELYALTQVGILAHWNFFGIALTTNRPLYFDATQRTNEPEISVVNTVVQKRAQSTMNYWGTRESVPARTRLYWVLRKREQSIGGNNLGIVPFEIVPFADPHRAHPSMRELYYKDYAGGNRDSYQVGYAWYVGYMHMPEQDDGMGKATRELAAGLIGGRGVHEAMAASAQLSRCNIQVRVGA